MVLGTRAPRGVVDDPRWENNLRQDRMEEILRDYFARLTGLEETVQRLDEDTVLEQLQAGMQNYIPNGDFDWNRNRFYYVTDYVSNDGRTDADVSKESAHWFVEVPDTAKESFSGAITASTAALTINSGEKAEFELSDQGNEIVVEGAGVGGADLVTTIQTYNSATSVTLADNASTTVSNARVRWNLQELKEDSTDVDYEASESPPSLVNDVEAAAIVNISSSYTVTPSNSPHQIIIADATSGAITVTLPAVGKMTNYQVTVKKVDSTANTVTVDGESAETIDEVATQVISTQYEALTLASDGTEWWII